MEFEESKPTTPPTGPRQLPTMAGVIRKATDMNCRPDCEDSLPFCDEECGSFDGKRCRITGSRPGRLCEPFVKILMATVADLPAERRGPVQGVIRAHGHVYDEIDGIPLPAHPGQRIDRRSDRA